MYYSFYIADPKPRHIHKASVRDRLLHHAVYRILYPFFDRTFIADSYSCRDGKGTHKAITRFVHMARQVSRNNTKTCWVLQCDIKKFFASIDHDVLITILQKYIPDPRIIDLLWNIIQSYSTLPDIATPVPEGSGRRVGLPLGNLTSQLFVNVYMNEFDQFVKHRLKARWYIRYADDFVILSENRDELVVFLTQLDEFLVTRLQLSLHPDKVSIKTLASGVDVLGWVHFPDHRVLRTATKRRVLSALNTNPSAESFQSYLGLLKHGNAYGLEQQLRNEYWLWKGHEELSQWNASVDNSLVSF